MSSQSIGPHEILSNETVVQVKNMRGLVKSHYVHSNGVVVHKIILTHKWKRSFGVHGKWEAMEKHITKEPNYSFVSVV